MASIVGKICSVSCENFVTYDKITVRPGKYLNLILGPNGTGKSSLVAAIVLGMGGEPKLLSRSNDICDYVKNGKLGSCVEVEIYVDDGGNTCTFRRAFDLKGTSVYKVNGSTVTLKNYLKQIQKYNIQISNLCQFMPQDRVQDFAKMNPQQLLNSTQEAISTPDMIERFNKLKELRNQQRNGDKTLVDNQKVLKELEERNAQLQNVIEKVKIRQNFLKDIEIGEKKRLWLELDNIQKDLDDMKGLLETAQYNLNRDEKIFNDVQTQSKNIIQIKEGLSTAAKNEADNAARLAAQLEKLEESAVEGETAILAAERDLKSKIADMADRDSEIQQATRLLEAYVQDLKVAMQEYGSEFRERMDAYNSIIKSKKQDILGLNEKRSDLNCEIEQYTPELNAIRNRINRIQNEAERRLGKLRQINEDAYKGVEWLRRNRHLFEGHVYEPMILELRMKQADNAKYLENTVARRDLLAFICTEKSDVNLLIRNLCNEQRLKINVLHSNSADRCHYRPDTPLSQLKRYGFNSYLLDMVEGPAPILNYLCSIYKIHKILVGTNEVEKHVETLPRDINLFFSNQNRFRIIISRYTGEASSVCSQIVEQNLLCPDIDEHLLNDLKSKLLNITSRTDELKNERNQIESKINEGNEYVNEQVKKRGVLEKKQGEILEKKRKVKFQEQRIHQLKETVIDIPTEQEKFKTICQQTLKKMIELQKRKVNSLREYQMALEKKEYSGTKLQIYRKETVDIENQLNTAEEDYKVAKKRFESLRKTEVEIKTKRDEKEAQALQLCDGKHRTDRQFPYNRKFARLSNNLQELEEHLIEMKTRAECLNEYEVDIADYENRQREIEQLQEKINSSQQNQEDLSEQIKKIHNVWYPYFTEKVGVINQTFSRFMELLEYAGEVNITHSALIDYDTYGIQILVQYRNNAKLQALDKYLQSGGERAVAIAIYSMSLQNLTHVPFRCVDEINQGMDAKNERKVFNLIVDETCQEGSSQYFFVTPKLLPDLHYNELLTALIVFNGQLSSTDVFKTSVP